MKLRKDKTNTAVYEAMKAALKHPYVDKLVDDLEVPDLDTLRTGFQPDYLNAERRLGIFFKTQTGSILPQLKDKYGAEATRGINKDLMPIFHCKGLVFNNRKDYQCHHPLCPLCHHRKHYRTIKDLRPYMRPGNRMHVIQLTEGFYLGQTAMAMDALENRAKKITAKLSPHVLQWSRQAHIRYERDELYAASCVIVVMLRETKEELLQSIYASYQGQIAEPITTPAVMSNMAPLLKNYLYYDPGLLQHRGGRVTVEWRNGAGFRYRAKHAHR